MAPPRRTAPRTEGHTLSVASRALDPAAECDSFLAVGVDASRHPVYEEDEMRKPILSVMLVAVSLTLELAHGDDSDESSDASAAVIEQIDASCSDWKAALDERGAFPCRSSIPRTLASRTCGP